METGMTQNDVLVVGAGPTGLVLALWLTKLGVKPRIIEKTASPGTTSRALAVHRSCGKCASSSTMRMVNFGFAARCQGGASDWEMPRSTGSSRRWLARWH
jgi:cation diffusion facilitator CzcD-associated flavoprotein CzcO